MSDYIIYYPYKGCSKSLQMISGESLRCRDFSDGTGTAITRPTKSVTHVFESIEELLLRSSTSCGQHRSHHILWKSVRKSHSALIFLLLIWLLFELVLIRNAYKNEISIKRGWGKVKMNFLLRENHICCE